MTNGHRRQLVTCALSGQQRPRAEMLRLIALPSNPGAIVTAVASSNLGWCIDRRENLPGKHRWIFPEARTIMGGDTQTLFQCTPKQLHQFLLDHLRARVTQTLHGVRRSGEYRIGGDRIRQWWTKSSGRTKHPTNILLVGACDGGSARLWHYLRKQHAREPDYCLHTQRELGVIFDRERLGAVLIFNSGLCLKIGQDMHSWQRLIGLT